MKLEKPSYLGLFGDIQNLKILDLACGDGFYTRMIKEMGAEITGIDISEEMIKLAKQYDDGINY